MIVVSLHSTYRYRGGCNNIWLEAFILRSSQTRLFITTRDVGWPSHYALHYRVGCNNTKQLAVRTDRYLKSPFLLLHEDFRGSHVAPVEYKSRPRLYMNWSILASVMDTPFPHNLEIAGYNPLHFPILVIMEETVNVQTALKYHECSLRYDHYCIYLYSERT